MSRKPPLNLPPRPNLSLEILLWKRGWQHIAGLDEAGRGALAGPVAVGAVILPPQADIAARLHGVRDSKEMTPLQRSHWAKMIRAQALTWAVGLASAQEIDALGIAAAIRLAAVRAVRGLSPQPHVFLLDYGIKISSPRPQESLVKGDRRSLSIAAASVLAKTTRDAIMQELDLLYPRYGLAQHKGYATRKHREAINAWGRSPIHRRSFRLKKRD